MLSRNEIDRRLAGGRVNVINPWLSTVRLTTPETEREALETAKQLSEWCYWLTRDCHNCPHWTHDSSGLWSLCGIPTGDQRPCYTVDSAALVWLEACGE